MHVLAFSSLRVSREMCHYSSTDVCIFLCGFIDLYAWCGFAFCPWKLAPRRGSTLESRCCPRWTWFCSQYYNLLIQVPLRSVQWKCYTYLCLQQAMMCASWKRITSSNGLYFSPCSAPLLAASTLSLATLSAAGALVVLALSE